MPVFGGERIARNDDEKEISQEKQQWVEKSIADIESDESIPKPVRDSLIKWINQLKARGEKISDLTAATGGKVSESGIVTEYPPTGKYNSLAHETTHQSYWGLQVHSVTPDGRIGNTSILLLKDGTTPQPHRG